MKETPLCPCCGNKMYIEGKYRPGSSYPFVCNQCEQLVMEIKSYEEETN